MKINSNISQNNFTQSQYDIAKEQKTSNKFDKILASKINNKEEEAQLYKACQELESVFINQLIQTMRSTVPKSEFLGDSFATETFESMLYEEYANKMSKTNTMGIAQLIYQQLKTNI